MREPASSYGESQRRKAQKRRGPLKAPRQSGRARGEFASRWTDDNVGRPPTQEERVEWARKEWRRAICRANAAGQNDPILNATVEGRRRDYERELMALERLEATTNRSKAS